jgi:hypothetical protein
MARQTKCPVVVAKLDRLSRDVAFIADLMIQRVRFIVAELAPMPILHAAPLCCISREGAATDFRAYQSGTSHPQAKWDQAGQSAHTAEAAAKGRAASVRNAQRFAETVSPIVQAIQRSGVTSLRGIATTLNNRGVRTARGGRWQVSNVRNLIAKRSVDSRNRALIDGNNSATSVRTLNFRPPRCIDRVTPGGKEGAKMNDPDNSIQFLRKQVIEAKDHLEPRSVIGNGRVRQERIRCMKAGTSPYGIAGKCPL